MRSRRCSIDGGTVLPGGVAFPTGGSDRKNIEEKQRFGHSWVYVRQYCVKIDEAARNRIELIVRSLAERNGVTEKLKADTKWNGYGR